MMIYLIVIGFFLGLFSEGLDRLWIAHFINQFSDFIASFPSQVLFFGLVRGTMLFVVLIAISILEKRVHDFSTGKLVNLLFISSLGIFLTLLGFVLIKSLIFVLVLFWLLYMFRAITEPLMDFWLNSNIHDPNTRTTLFSVKGQADAVGQIAGGPITGIIGNIYSVKAALLTSTLMLFPVIPLFVFLKIRLRKNKEEL